MTTMERPAAAGWVCGILIVVVVGLVACAAVSQAAPADSARAGKTAPAAPAASRWPELELQAGRVFSIRGTPNEGGISLGAAALWPVSAGLRVGAALTADDMGDQIGRLTDPNDGVDLGAVATLHRWALGLGWRLDGQLPQRFGFAPFVSGTWGWYRVSDDVRGDKKGDIGSTGAGLGAGVRRSVGGGWLGFSGRYQLLFNDRVERFASAGLDWSWR